MPSPSNYKVTGIDLDSVFRQRTSGPVSSVNFRVNGIDISGRYEVSNQQGSSSPDQIQYDTDYVYNGVDLRYFFKNINAQNGPTINNQPSDTTVNAGQVIQFTTAGTTSGGTLYYQWQKYDGQDFVNLTNGARISGATTVTLTITNAVNSTDQGSYRCKLTDSNGSVTTQTVTATVNYQPITTGPNNASYNENDSPVIFVSASAQPTPSYAWKKDGVDIQQTTDGGIYQGYNSSTLTISSIPRSVNGASYTCVVSNTVGSTTSSAAIITVHYQSEITLQPESKIVNIGDSTNISLIAVGRTTPTYQWQKRISGTWTNLSNDTHISGVLTNSLVFVNIILENAGEYRCVLTNIKADSVSTWTTISDVVNLSVYSAPVITTNPTGGSFNSGDAIGLSVVAQETYPLGLSYQWKINGSNITSGMGYSGYNTKDLTFIADYTHDQKQFTCAVSNGFGSVTSSAATLTIYYQSIINTQPSNSTVFSSSNATFTLTAVGRTTPTYQWQKSADSINWTSLSNGAKYTGVNTNTLNILDCQTSDTAYYQCLLNNYKFGGSSPWPQTISNTRYLIVYQPPVITTHPQNTSSNDADPTTFTVVVSPGLPSQIAYQWQKYNSSTLIWEDINSSTDGGIYGQISYLTNQLSFSANPDLDQAQYKCQIYNGFGSPIYSNPATLTVYYQPEIITFPISYTKNEGENVTFTVSAIGRTSPNYQWQKWTGTIWQNLSNAGRISGATSSSLTITSIESSDNGSYQCVVTNYKKNLTDTWTTTSSEGILTVRYINITGGTINQDILFSIGDVATYTISTTAYPSINSYTYRKNGDIVQSTVTYSPYQFVTASNSAGTYSLTISNGFVTKTIVSNFYVQPSITTNPSNASSNEGGSATFSIAAVGSSLTYQWQVSSDGGANWNNISNEQTTSLSISSIQKSLNGYKYRCVVSNSLNVLNFPTIPAISTAATLTVYYAPAITTQPISAYLNITNVCSFVAAATAGNPQTNYRWYRSNDGGLNYDAIDASTDGGIYAGYSGATTSANLTFVVSNPLKNFKYYCKFDNGNGAISDSQAATLYVNPNITAQPSNSATYIGQTAIFSVAANGSGTLAYQWYENSIPISGATSSSYNKTGVTQADEGKQYYCTVTTNISAFSTSSSPATLSIYYAPTINTQPANQFGNVGSTVTFSVSASAGVPATITYKWYRSINNGVSFAEISGANLANYTTPSITNAMKGYQYRCEVGNGDPNILGKVTSTAGILYINPNFTTNLPSTNSVTIGNGQVSTTAVFSVTVEGSKTSAFTYDWQMKPSGGTFNSIAGADTSSSSFAETTVTTSYNNRQYRVIVSSDLLGTTAATSNASTLTVSVNNISISSFTSDKGSNPTVNLGQSLTYTVTATGSGNLTYTFYKRNSPTFPYNDEVVQSSSSNQYTFTPSLSDNGKQFFCAVNSSISSIPTANTTLSSLTVQYLIIGDVSISSNGNVFYANSSNPPTSYQNIEIEGGKSTTFSISATSSPATINYSWRKWNGLNYNSIIGTSSTYNIASPSASDTEYYACYLSNSGGVTATTAGTSKEFRLVVLTPITVSAFSGNGVANPVLNIGNSLTYSVTASGSGTLIYNFYRRNYTNYPSVFNDTLVQSNTSNTYTHTIQQGEGGDGFFCLVTSSKSILTPKYTNFVSELTTIDNVVFNQIVDGNVVNQYEIINNDYPNPAWATVAVDIGDSITIEINTSSNLTLSYQWWKYDPVNGFQQYSTLKKISIPSVSSSDFSYYYCNVFYGGTYATTSSTNKQFQIINANP